jgi:hypothetical protein
MTTKFKARVRIAKQNSSRDGDMIALEVIDDASGIFLLEIEMTPEEFGKALLFNREADGDAQLYTGAIPAIGKQRQHKTHVFELEKARLAKVFPQITTKGVYALSSNEGNCQKELANYLEAILENETENDGWQVGSYFGSRDQIREDHKTGLVRITAQLFRYVATSKGVSQ